MIKSTKTTTFLKNDFNQITKLFIRRDVMIVSSNSQITAFQFIENSNRGFNQPEAAIKHIKKRTKFLRLF